MPDAAVDLIEEWTPDLADRSGPRYRAIAEAMEHDIRTGALPVGSRLPTHRDLAWRLNVTVGTVTRAYKEATTRGLIDGEIGRGTFVRDRRIRQWGAVADRGPATTIDFGPNFTPLSAETEGLFRETLAEVALDRTLGPMSGYEPSGGRIEHRARLADWIRTTGAPASAETTLITAGVQHGLAIVMTALFEPGDAIVCARLTHPGAKSLAIRRGLRLISVASDEDGVLPDALEAACRLNRPKGVFVIPTLDNPTSVIMSGQRRAQIAEVAARQDLIVVEDDVYRGFAPEAAAPIASLIPDRAVYLHSSSKHLAPGLRVGAMSAPEAWRPRLQPCLRDMMWMAPPSMVEVLIRWLDNGTAARMESEKREEMAGRQALVREMLAPYPIASHPTGLQAWLELPEAWWGRNAAGALLEAGVSVTAGEVFETTSGAGRGQIRLALGCPDSRDTLSRGLNLIRSVLDNSPDQLGDFM